MLPTFPSADQFDRFGKNFFGYGDLSASIWLIGMEEGGGNTQSEVQSRIRAWRERGCRRIEDVADYHDAFIGGKGFAAIDRQPTWVAISRIILAARGQPTTTGAVARFWKTELGRAGSKTCILELNPLPSPKLTTWHYGFCFDNIPFLKNRDAYNKHFRHDRVNSLRNLIATRKPKVVIFYGTKYSKYWSQISNGKFPYDPLLRSFSAEGHLYCEIPHSSERLKDNGSALHERLGRKIREHLIGVASL